MSERVPIVKEIDISVAPEKVKNDPVLDRIFAELGDEEEAQAVRALLSQFSDKINAFMTEKHSMLKLDGKPIFDENIFLDNLRSGSMRGNIEMSIELVDEYNKSVEKALFKYEKFKKVEEDIRKEVGSGGIAALKEKYERYKPVDLSEVSIFDSIFFPETFDTLIGPININDKEAVLASKQRGKEERKRLWGLKKELAEEYDSKDEQNRKGLAGKTLGKVTRFLLGRSHKAGKQFINIHRLIEDHKRFSAKAAQDAIHGAELDSYSIVDQVASLRDTYMLTMDRLSDSVRELLAVSPGTELDDPLKIKMKEIGDFIKSYKIFQEKNPFILELLDHRAVDSGSSSVKEIETGLGDIEKRFGNIEKIEEKDKKDKADKSKRESDQKIKQKSEPKPKIKDKKPEIITPPPIIKEYVREQERNKQKERDAESLARALRLVKDAIER